MPNNKLILRSVNSPWVSPFNDITTGSVLSWADVDNNFIYLKGELIYSALTSGSDLILKKINGNDLTVDLSEFNDEGNRWHIPFGTTIEVMENYQSFIYGDLYIEGLLKLNDGAQLVVLNGDIIMSGGSISGNGTTLLVQLPEFDTNVTGATFNPISGVATFTNNSGGTFSLSGLAGSEIFVTGGTYNPSTGVATFINNSGGTFNVSGFLTGYTNYYTTGATLVNNVAYFDRTDVLSAYTLNLSSLEFTGNTSASCITELWVSNIHGCSPITIHDSIQHNTSTASGLLSTAFGGSNVSSGNYSHAEGYGNTAGGDYSHVEGRQTTTTNSFSHAEGWLTTSTGQYSHVEGVSSTANGFGSHAEGNTTIANGESSHAEGQYTQANGDRSHAEGYQTIASGFGSHSENTNTRANGTGSHAEGDSSTSQGDYSHAEGQLTSAIGIHSHSEGYQTTASGGQSHTEGYQTTANGARSHSEGSNTIASGFVSHAEGYQTISNGFGSHAEGNTTFANNDASHAEGYGTSSVGYSSHGEGGWTKAIGNYSHSEGYYTTASGGFSHTEGYTTTAIGTYSHAGGVSSVASGLGSFIHSSGSTVTGNRSVVLGGKNLTGAANDTVYVPNFNSRGNSIFSGSSTGVVTIIGSGSTSPIFTIQGSSGELFSVTDSLVGSLFSVNDISGLPILEAFSDNTILMGSYQSPSLNTTIKKTLTSGTNNIYSIPTSAYTGAFFDYTLLSSSGARAGNIMSIWSGSSAQYTDTSTNDIGSTSGVTFSVVVSGSSAVLVASGTTSGWTLKTIVRSI
jgi:hypothetical protein